MELSIVVTHYRNPELLKECLSSIKNNTFLPEYELIVADSETEERTALLLKNEFPEVKHLAFKENTGFSRLVYDGYKASHGVYILFLNGDMVMKKNSIDNLLAFIKSRPDAGMVGPKLLNFNGTAQPSAFRFYTPLTIVYRRTFLGKLGFAKKHLSRFLMEDRDFLKVQEVDWIMGSAMMTRRSAVEKVGLIDTRFVSYFEDVDWCRRFWKNGYKVLYFPGSEMYHFHGKFSANKDIIRASFFNKYGRKNSPIVHIISSIKYFLKYWGEPIPKHN